jgi:predicted transcriptional regulator
VLGGRKVNGAGSGHVEYRLPWPAGLRAADVAGATFLAELSAKRLLGKDRDTTAGPGGDYMRGGGLHDPGRNPNAYPMTGVRKYPSAVTVRVNGSVAARVELADDPADSRGILSWHAQPTGDPKRRRLTEAGSYGELVRVALPPAALAAAERAGAVVVRLEVSDALPGGLAVYGREFGRYPLDPTVLFVLRQPSAGTPTSPTTGTSTSRPSTASTGRIP